MATKKQMEYLKMYQSGATMQEIADKYGVYRSTVSRTIARAKKVKCPFSSDCTSCPLPDCAIKTEYACIMNTVEDAKRADIDKY